MNGSSAAMLPQFKISFSSPVSCSLPEQQSDLLEELQYTELPQEQAQTLLQEYKDEARRLLPPILKPEKKKHGAHKKRPHPHGPPPSHRMHWTRLNGQNGGMAGCILGDFDFFLIC